MLRRPGHRVTATPAYDTRISLLSPPCCIFSLDTFWTLGREKEDDDDDVVVVVGRINETRPPGSIERRRIIFMITFHSLYKVSDSHLGLIIIRRLIENMAHKRAKYTVPRQTRTCGSAVSSPSFIFVYSIANKQLLFTSKRGPRTWNQSNPLSILNRFDPENSAFSTCAVSIDAAHGSTSALRKYCT